MSPPSSVDGWDDGQTVRVSRTGQTTIANAKRQQHNHNISAPGRVLFRTNDAGELVIEPVAGISEYRGVGSGAGTKRLRDRAEEDPPDPRD